MRVRGPLTCARCGDHHFLEMAIDGNKLVLLISLFDGGTEADLLGSAEMVEVFPVDGNQGQVVGDLFFVGHAVCLGPNLGVSASHSVKQIHLVI